MLPLASDAGTYYDWSIAEISDYLFMMRWYKNEFSSHWNEKIVFSRQFVDVLNPFIGCQQN